MKSFNFFTIICFLLTFSFQFSLAQTQIGQTIAGAGGGGLSGSSVDLSENGDFMVIGAPNYFNSSCSCSPGQAGVFELIDNVWTQVGPDINGEDHGDKAGMSVAISSNGQRMAIGSPQHGLGGVTRVFGYFPDQDAWFIFGEFSKIEMDELGHAVDMSGDGNWVIMGAPSHDGNGSNSGLAVVYDFNSLQQIGQDILGEAAGDQAGWSVAISQDGNRIAVGSRGNDGPVGFGDNYGHVRIYEYNSGTEMWDLLGDEIIGEFPDDESGWDVDLSADGSRVIIGVRFNFDNGSYKGHARVYEFSSGNWTQVGSDIDGEADDDQLGQAVAISGDGNQVVVHAHRDDGQTTGYTRLYRLLNDDWQQVGMDINGETEFAGQTSAVAISSDGNIMAIGNPYSDNSDTRAFDFSSSLAVQLFEFEGFVKNEAILVQWLSNNDPQLEGFILEQSIDGKTWKDLGFVPKTQDSKSMQDYEFMHKNPIVGVNYYRLKQVQLGQQEVISKTINIYFTSPENIQIFPNPTKGMLTVNLFENPIVPMTAHIKDVTGREVQEFELDSQDGKYRFSIDLNSYPNGVYFLNIEQYPYQRMEKIIKY